MPANGETGSHPPQHPGAEKRARVGWEYCHSILDDHSRLVYSELHRDERATTVTAGSPMAKAGYIDNATCWAQKKGGAC